MLAMTGHAKKLSDLGIVIPNRLGINRVLQSLPPSYKNFVMNYNMQNMNKELPELFAMLKSAEIEIKKEHQVLMVNKTTSFKKQGKSKGKNKKSGKKAATPPVKPKAGPKPDAECYYCKEKGHWKRNCSKYLADLKSGLVKKKKEGISMNEVRKKLFTISLSGKAAHWYKLLKNGDSIDWEDIVPLFYSKFYPPSEIHKDRNRIYNFWPHDGESIAQAWGRLKSLMLKCPIHELPGNVIIDNFYARLSFQDKTLLDTSCSGSFTRKNEEFKRDLLDRIQENTEGWENDKDRESGISEAFRKERDELEEIFRRQPILKHDLPVEDLGTTPPPKEDPVFDLKPLPDNLKYAHIDDKKIYPVIISSKLSEIEEERLLEILKKHRGAIGYTLDDLKGISPSICQHAINMEEDAKPVVEHQRRLIPKMKEVVRNEVLKLLEAGIIYPIADSRWVSPVHCVPKKGGMTVVPNDNDELIPQRIVVDRKGADNPVADNLSRLENIAYDPVPVNDSFPNEQLAVIKVSSRESPWICFGSRSIMSSSGTQKDSFFEDVVNPYMNELKMHPKELQLVDGELQIKDVQGPKGEGSLEDRMEKLEQEVFNYKKMAEREVDIFHKIVSELIDGHKKETAKLWDDIFSLHDTTNKLQAQLYDVHNQNCEYENRFKRISHAASFRFPETKMSFVDGGPLPWKSDDDKDSPSSPKE
ncbi:hypothetical protein QYE76_033241 [Lolium multiflorum]|uniref:CCHC-type domain-containing protein n=1 Tax=Lolium multiflorum TaxID=4521 RepID=A0AAD8QYQ8_LOLMU|nr:hypothetical protein QYE76_033241 [Lolium multiflorum]